VIGKEIHDFASSLWLYPRSITGSGVRQTLNSIKEILPEIEIFEVPSGTKCFDWTIPQEWKVNNAYLVDPQGNKIIDFENNNLHLLNYSIKFIDKVDFSELDSHLYSLPNQPDAIPYVTSYYEENWGFCISENLRKTLKSGTYEVNIDTEKFDGSMSYAELYIPGKTQDEVFFSTYICHPSMANNELSGISLLTYLAKYINALENRKYSYRIIFIPETIGSIYYISKNLNELKKFVKFGFNVTCVGDERTFSLLQSKYSSANGDKVARHVLRHIYPKFESYTWEQRGSDERQYSSPGVDLAITSVMRSKYGTYPEYHTSLDDLINVVTPKGLEESYNAYIKMIDVIENDCVPKSAVFCEPMLGRRGLYKNVSIKTNFFKDDSRNFLNILTYSDGKNSLLDIAERLDLPAWEIFDYVKVLENNNLITI
jgi:aminopeptidase-like protein